MSRFFAFAASLPRVVSAESRWNNGLDAVLKALQTALSVTVNRVEGTSALPLVHPANIAIPMINVAATTVVFRTRSSSASRHHLSWQPSCVSHNTGPGIRLSLVIPSFTRQIFLVKRLWRQEEHFAGRDYDLAMPHSLGHQAGFACFKMDRFLKV